MGHWALRPVNWLLQLLGLKLVGSEILQFGRKWNAINIGRVPRTIIDVGCAYDTWEFYDAFPDAYLVLVDPLIEYERHNDRILARRSGRKLLTALGDHIGELVLNVDRDRPVLTSALDRTELTARPKHRLERRRVPITTIDDLVTRHAIQGPFGIKIDTEGFELPIIEGALETLKSTYFVILEVSVQKRFHGAPSLRSIIERMAELGFEVCNILDVQSDGQGLVRNVDILFGNERLGCCG